MNKSYIKSCIIAVVLVVLMPCIALATPPHDTQTDCNTKCHQTHKTLGTVGYNNICLNCHRFGSSDPRYAQIYPYAISDQSLHQTGPSKGVMKPGYMQTSHRWEGSDDNPRVGAVPPTSIALQGHDPSVAAQANTFVGELTCARCHALHGADGYAASFNPPFLRMANNEDQMCLDCHKPRNVTSQESASHPININYSSIAKRKPSEYFNPPMKAYSTNYTANMKIINGKVLCSTCHGVHHSDSNSRTYDNFSSVIFNGLSSSKGYLLRADLKGANSSDRNICTTCHKTTDDDLNAKVKSHNGVTRKQNIQCADCHGGHVNEVDGKPVNKFLIKRFMDFSSPNSNRITKQEVVFQYTSLSKRNYNQDAFGVCLACHMVLPNTINDHNNPTTAATCNKCHTHKAGFSANCTDCHGMPPSQNLEDGPFGYAKGYNRAVNEALSPHQSHASGAYGVNNYYAFSCNDCHKEIANSNQHGNTVFQDVFNNLNGTKAGLLSGYNRTNLTCSNVYCHSNGLPTNAPAVYTTVTWGNNKDSIIGASGSVRCSQCHLDVPTTNAHTKHINNGLLNGCVNCHATTVSGNTTLLDTQLYSARLTGGAHVNNIKDIKFSGTIGTSVLEGTTLASCANVYCHTDGKLTPAVVTPIWSNPATGACGTCHVTTHPPKDATNNAHFAHLSSVYGPNLNAKGMPLSCNVCHAYPTNHVDGSIQQPANSTCTTNCHKSGVPNWKLSGSTHRLDCAACHTAGTLSVFETVIAPPTAGVNFQTLGHGKPSINKVCIDCHDPNKPHLNTNPTVHDTRLNAVLTDTTDPKVKCSYCHNNPVIVPTAKFRNMSTHFLTKGGTTNMSCSACHDVHGTSNLSALKTSFAFINSTSWTVTFTNNTANSSFVQPNGRGLCQVCHTNTTHYRAGVGADDHFTGQRCTKCHPHNTKDGAFAPIGGGCDGCHGYPPIPKSSVKMATNDPLYSSTLVSTSPLYKKTYGFTGNYSSARFEDYSGGGAAHLNHVVTNARPADEWSHCTPCHLGGHIPTKIEVIPSHKMSPTGKAMVPNVTINMDPSVKFSNVHQMIYSGARMTSPVANKTGKCMNISCHFQPSPRWSKDR